MIINVFGWVLFGSTAGVVAKLATPGRDRGGFAPDILLGIVGAVLGGGIGTVIGQNDPRPTIVWVSSILGAIALLSLRRVFTGDGGEPLVK